MTLSLSHWYPGSGVSLIVSIPDLCTLSYFGRESEAKGVYQTKWTCKLICALLFSYTKVRPKSYFAFSLVDLSFIARVENSFTITNTMTHMFT